MDTVTLGKQEQELEKQGSKMDTVTLGKQEQELEKQGPWGQADVSYGGKADLHKQLNIFVKNPSPQKCIPAEQFNVDHLPSGCRDNDLVDNVQAQSDITVRVSVKYVSERRPETVPGSDKPYPRYMGRDRNMMRTGTGSVCRVDKYPNWRDISRICKCWDCVVSPTPKTKFAKIYIKTAAHVVYDELEAAHTTCHLFFDKGGSPRDSSSVLELCGWDFVMKEEDWCLMEHVTHNLDLADLLDKMVPRQVNPSKKVNIKYPGLKSGEQKPSSPSEHLPEILEKINIKYLGLESGEQESSSPSEYLPEVWDTVNNKHRGLESWEQKSSSPSEHLPEVLDNLPIKVSHPDGSNKQVQINENTLKKAASTYQTNVDTLSESESCLPSLNDETATKSCEGKPDWIHRQKENEQHHKVVEIHGELTTIVTNQDISQSAKTHDLVANSQNMGKVDEEKECSSNLLSVETEPRENLNKSEPTYRIEADKLPESESFLLSLTDETATKSCEDQPDWLHRATKIIIVLNCILCLVTVTLTVALVKLGGGNKGGEQLRQETCVQCSKLLSNTAHSIEADPLLNKLTLKRLDNGLQMCCAQDEGQMSVLWEVAARKRTALQTPKPHGMVANPRSFPVSIKKQLLPVGDSELNRTEVLMNHDGQHHVLTFCTDYHDPLTEHVRGVKVLDSAIEINYTGLYYVYMNIFIHVKSPQPPRSLLFQNWYQKVHRTRPGDPNNSGFILEIAHTTLMENINDQATAFAGGTFYLKKGDLIKVGVNGLGLLDYQKEFTFLGLFMLENGEMKQEMFF